MVVEFVERALRGKCAICGRRLPSRRIGLYHALVRSWDIEAGEDKHDVEVAVCGEKCLDRYNDGAAPP